MRSWIVLAALLLAALPLAQAHADSAAQGKAIFPICAACHSLAPGVNKIGPSLHGVIGQKAGTAAGFDFSPAMKAAGFVWTPDKLAAFLNDPAATVPGNKMPYAGTHNMDTAKSIVDYLQQVAK